MLINARLFECFFVAFQLISRLCWGVLHGYLQLDSSATLTINLLLFSGMKLLGSTMFVFIPAGLNSAAVVGDVEQQSAGSVPVQHSNQDDFSAQPGSSNQNAEPVQQNAGYVNEGLED